MVMSASSSQHKDQDSRGSSDVASDAKSTLSILKEFRAGSTGFGDFYDKVWDQITGVKPYYGILDYPTSFLLRIVIIVVGSIFLNDCPAEPMLPIYLIVHGVVGLCIQIIDEIAGSYLLKNDNTIWGKAKVYYSNILAFFLFCWFVAGCVWVFRTPLPNMIRFPDGAAASIIDLMMLSPTTSSLSNDQMTAMNSTLNTFLAPENHCAFPVYGLAVWRVLSLIFVDIGGCLVIVIVTTTVLYLLPEVKNVRNTELLQMSDVC